MDISAYALFFKPGWDRHFKNFDLSIQQRILRKLDQMKQPLPARGLHASRFKVEEVGGYRIAFIQEEEKKTKSIHFVGTHKQYEKWYSEK